MSVAEAFVETVFDGPLLLALPVAAIAGLVSFLSPCVLPLVPGYLSYVTGLSGAELAGERAPADRADRLVRASSSPPQRDVVALGGGPVGTRVAAPPAAAVDAPPVPLRRGRVLAGSLLFVLGFSAVFVTSGAFFGYLGGQLVAHQAVLNRVLGVLTVLLGLVFLGWLPGLQRTVRFHRMPSAGLAGAPLLGVLFGVGWTPCLGPTLAAVQTLAFDQASAGRGALLTAGYCAGLGVPFVLTGLMFQRALGAFAVIRRHSAVITRAGGLMLVGVGLLLVSGLWETAMVELRTWVSAFETAV